MKTRIMIYVCLFLVLAGGIFYVTQREQAPTGLATGSQLIKIYGKITEVSGRPTDDTICLEVKDDTGTEYRFKCEDSLLVPMIISAYHAQNTCWLKSEYKDSLGWDMVTGFIMAVDYEAPVTNADVIDEIKKVSTSINYLRNYLRWILRYVYWTYRRVR